MYLVLYSEQSDMVDQVLEFNQNQFYLTFQKGRQLFGNAFLVAMLSQG